MNRPVPVREKRRRGELVARALTCAWRLAPPRLDLSADELATVTPLLLSMGAGGVGWWRIRDSHLAAAAEGVQLHEAWRLHTLHAALQQAQIARAVGLLRSAGVEPVLVKGWAIGRLYPEPGLRPYGDIDLVVRPQEHDAAQRALIHTGTPRPPVDLHNGFPDLNDRPLDELYRRSQVLPLGDVRVRVPGPEDHLRILCLHLLRHGARRALLLCDIAVALEHIPADFDWDYFLAGDPRRADWAIWILELARTILGAPIHQPVMEERMRRMPGWLPGSLLRQWGNSFESIPSAFETCLRHPRGLPEAVKDRWPNPMEALYRRGGSVAGLPPLLFQVGDILVRGMMFADRAAGRVGGRLRMKASARAQREIETPG